MDRGKAAAIALATLVASFAFVLYRSTLLPGFDFGDTPSFQVMAGEPAITPRDGYPLYFALGRLFVLAFPGDKAHALNVASAIYGALACGLVLVLAAELSGSLLAGAAAAILLAGSYTFWSQSVITEVYTLHILLVTLTLVLLLRWERRQTNGRLGLFVAVYALAFGNHLSMVLLAPALFLFLVLSARHTGTRLFTLTAILMTVALTAAGAMQYLWNFRALALKPLPPAGLADAFNAFWFDVTKADWRESMVGQVPTVVASDRLAMFAFDTWQQFGWPGILLTIAGLGQLLRTNVRRGLLLLMAYLCSAAFALTYNVGDSHVFFLTPHLMTALLAAPGIVLVAGAARWRKAMPAAAALGICYGLARIYADYPALDRSEDRRPRETLDAFSAGVDDRTAVLLTNLNWQVENGLNYYGREVRPELSVVPLQTVLPHVPAIVRDNAAIGRQVLADERAGVELQRVHDAVLSEAPDSRVPTTSLLDLVRTLPPGTRYVLCVLRPTRDQAIDRNDFSAALRALTGSQLEQLDVTRYTAIAGLTGASPVLAESHDGPWRRSFAINGLPVVVRMDAWLTFDTIRRMGFGHVIANRRHTLIVDRGISFAAFDESGTATVRGYAANIFAPPARYVVSPAP